MKNITEQSKIDTHLVEKQISLIDELNEKMSTDKGEWVTTKTHGIVWKPKISIDIAMSGHDATVAEYQPPVDTNPPSLLDGLVKWGNKFDFDNIAKNSVVLIKLNVKDPMRVQMMQRAIAKQVLEPRVEKLKANQVCVLFMQSDDDITIMSEEDMKAAGWEKKEKKLIITLNA